MPFRSLSADRPAYVLYKKRFVGLAALALLNIVAAMSVPWFGPISNDVSRDFDITLNQVNWLGIIISLTYLPTSLLIPFIVSKYGISRCCQIGAVALFLSAWIRCAGAVRTVPGGIAYALLILGQVFSAIAESTFQLLGPKYSETWFDLKGRTTATMVAAIANPIGLALGQLLSPTFKDTRQSILALGIISTAAAPLALLVARAPPTPPTHAASKTSATPRSLFNAIVGRVDPSSDAFMSIQSRIDFAIVALNFSVMVATARTFCILTGEIFGPVGYDATISGLLGACLLLTGIVAVAITAPLLNRVFTRHLGVAIKLLVPILTGAWLSLIWAVNPHNTGSLFAIMTILGVTSITLLPIALELSADLTKNADGSSAVLWFMSNMFTIFLILAEQTLRAGPNESYPNNMHRALIFNGVFVVAIGTLVFLVQGSQERKRIDEEKAKEFE